MEYTYLGTKLTDIPLLYMQVNAVRNPKGRCVVRNGNQLVVDEGGKRHVVIGRRLRKNKPFEPIDRAEALALISAQFGEGIMSEGQFYICRGEYVDWDSVDYDEYFLMGRINPDETIVLAFKEIQQSAQTHPKQQKKPRNSKK